MSFGSALRLALLPESTRWRPILHGAARQEALATVEAIATALRRSPRIARYAFSADPALRAIEGASLAGGKAGIAVFYSYLAAAHRDENAAAVAVRFLNDAAEAVASLRMSASLYGGFTGAAWAMTHLGKRLDQFDSADATTVVDDALLALVQRKPWRGDYDVVSGLVGFGVYALERLPSATAAECLRRVVDRLDESGKRTSQGICWFTPPELLPAHHRHWYPKGCYNLGLAHGVPAIIGFLAACRAAGVARRKARTLLRGAITWLENQALPRGSASTFPTTIGPGVQPSASRAAWCYGDPGIAVALLLAGQSLPEPKWTRRAIELALNAASRTPTEARVVDAGLCHGAAGLAHIFNRIAQATGEKRLVEAARRWFAYAFELRRPGRGIAGFAARLPRRDGKTRWVADPGILTGAAGVALALLAAATPIEPEWDRMLLVSVRPRRRDNWHERNS